MTVKTLESMTRPELEARVIGLEMQQENRPPRTVAEQYTIESLVWSLGHAIEQYGRAIRLLAVNGDENGNDVNLVAVSDEIDRLNDEYLGPEYLNELRRGKEGAA